MRTAVIASATGHALIIGWGLVSLPFSEPLAPLEKPLPVDIVSVEEFTRVKAGEQKAEPKEVPAPPKPKPEAVEAARETEKPTEAKAQRTAPEISDEPKPEEMQTASLPPEPEPAPAPKPEPKPEKAEPAPQPTNVPVPQPKPKVAERPKPAEPKPEPKQPEPPQPKPEPQTAKKPEEKPAPKPDRGGFSADKIAALLNKVPEAGGAVSGDGVDEPGQGAPQGVDMSLSISEIDALRRQIAQCWNPPIGVLDAGRMIVKLDIAFNPDGTLQRDPQLVNPSGQQIFMIAAEAAKRAVISCQPYNLPVEKYDLWQQVLVNFDPRDMLGG